MHDVTRTALCQHARQLGPELWRDPHRCAQLLRAACPGYAHDITLLLVAVEAKLPDDLRQLPASAVWADVSPAFLGRLGTLPPQQAVWVLESWALALCKIHASQLSPPPATSDSEDSERQLGLNGWLWALMAFSIAVYGFNGWVAGGVIGGLIDPETGRHPGSLVGLALALPSFLLVARLLPINSYRWLTMLTGISAVALTTTVAILWSWGGLVGAMLGGLFASVLTIPALLFGSMVIELTFRLYIRPLWQELFLATACVAVALAVALAVGDWHGWASGGAAGFVLVRLGFGGINLWATRADRPAGKLLLTLTPSVLVAALAGALAGLLGWWFSAQLLPAVLKAKPPAFYLDLARQDPLLAMGLIYLTLAAGMLLPAFGLAFWAARKVAQQGNPSNRFVGHTGAVHGIAFAPDGLHLATAGADGTVRLWEVPTLHEVACFTGHTGAVTAVAWTPDGLRLVTAGVDNTLRTWDVQQRIPLRNLSIPDERPGRVVLAMTNDGLHAVTGSSIGSLSLWHLETGVATSLSTGDVNTLAIAPGGTLLAAAGKDGTLRLWDVRAGTEQAVLPGHTAAVLGVAFLDDSQLVSASHDRTVRLWDVGTRQLIASSAPEKAFPLTCVAAISSGLVITGGEDGMVRVRPTGEDEDEQTFGEPGSRVEAVAIDRLGTKVAAAHADGSVRLWTLPQPGDEDFAHHEEAHAPGSSA